MISDGARIIMITANLFSGVICLIFGLIIQTGKASFLISGYNSMSKEEQTKWDEKALGKFMGWVTLIIPSVFLLVACIPMLLNIFPLAALLTSWIMFGMFCFGGVLYMNLCSYRFKSTK